MKKKRPVRRVLAWALALILIVGVLGCAAAFQAAGKMALTPLDRDTRAALAAIPKGGAGVTNILLLGADEQEGGRSDTMLLLSIDRIHRKLKLTSILRDSWVKFPGGGSEKINAAASRGGGALAMRVVGETFQVHIDHYLLLNFTAFEKAIDALGGIAVPIEPSEIKFLCKNTRLGKQIGQKSMEEQMAKSGKVKLNGIQALIFVRIRKLDDDLRRAQRQRIMMNAIVAKVKANPLRLLAVAQKALPSVQTDMTPAQATALAALAPYYYLFAVEEFQLPADHTWSFGRKNGLSVITLDEKENAKRLKEFIYGG